MPPAAASAGAPSPRSRQNARGEATRELLLRTAERLFAERGIKAVPLRDIGIAAGQKNNVAVQYHFGDREALVREVATHRAEFVEQIQVEFIAEMLAKGRPPAIIDYVRSFVRSLAHNLEETDNHYLPFLSRYMSEHGGYAGLESTVSQSTSTMLHTLMVRMLPDLSDDVMSQRWEIVMTTAVHTLARYQAAAASRTLTAPLPELIEDLVVFLAAGLEAPVTD